MKNLILTIFTTFLLLNTTFSQTIAPYKLFIDGTQATLTTYDNLNQVKSISNFRYANVIKSGLNLSVNSNTNITDGNGSTLLNKDYGIKLNVNTTTQTQSLFYDMKYFMPLNVAIQFKNYSVIATGNAYEIPSQISIGQILPNIRINYNFIPNLSGLSSATTTVSYMNRTVQKREKVTTTAGTFTCWKITEDAEIKTNIITKQKISRWINGDIGFVKIEIRDTNGNLLETEELTRFRLPSISNTK